MWSHLPGPPAFQGLIAQHKKDPTCTHTHTDKIWPPMKSKCIAKVVSYAVLSQYFNVAHSSDYRNRFGGKNTPQQLATHQWHVHGCRAKHGIYTSQLYSTVVLRCVGLYIRTFQCGVMELPQGFAVWSSVYWYLYKFQPAIAYIPPKMSHQQTLILLYVM